MKLRVAQCCPYCVYVGPNLVRSCRQKVPSCTMLGLLLHSVASTSGLTKHSEARLFYLFPYLHLLSSDSFSSLILSLLFSSLTLPTSAFPSVHIVGSLTSKLTFDNTQGAGGIGKIVHVWHPVLSLNLAQFSTLWSFVAREETDKNCKVHPTFAWKLGNK